jgi:MFS family permease
MTGPLGHRRFRILLAGRAVSMLGNAIAPVAIAFAVLDLTGSAAALGIVLAARSIPQILFMLAGGVIADRFDRARVLVVANVVAGVAQGAAAALLLTGTASVPALAVLEAVNGTASAIVFPAAAALTPVTVPSTILQEANALLRLGLNTAMIVGAASGGILVGTIGSGWGLAVDAMAFVLAAAFFTRLRIGSAASVSRPGGSPPASTGGVGAVLADVRDGWREVFSRSWLWAVVIAFGFANAAQAAGWTTLGPVVAAGSVGPEGWGLVLAGQTAGMLAGGVLMLRVRPIRPLFVGCAAVLLLAPMLVVLALQPTVAALLPAAFAAGVGIEGLQRRLGSLPSAAGAAGPALPGVFLRRAWLVRHDPAGPARGRAARARARNSGCDLGLRHGHRDRDRDDLGRAERSPSTQNRRAS